MCLHHVPWYAKRATGIQTVASSEPEVYKPGAGNHWRVVCVGAVPLKPSNHAITLHFATLFNLRKETLFRGLKIGLCSRTFVTLNLESVRCLVIKPVTPQCRPRTSKDHTPQNCVPCLRQDSGTHVRLSQIRKCQQEPNIILRIFKLVNLATLSIQFWVLHSSTDNTVSVYKFTPFRCSGSWLTSARVINRAENEDTLF